MKYLKCMIFGFIIYGLYEISGLFFGFFTTNPKFDLKVWLFLIILVALFGALITAPFPKIYKILPGSNRYIKTLAYFIIVSLLSYLLTGFKNIISFATFFNLIVTVIISLLFVVLNNIYNKEIYI